MAIYHFSMKAISRSKGRSSTASAAYRAGIKIVDKVTGEVFDYTHKKGVEASGLIMPPGVDKVDRGEFWNSVELHHRRGDALVAREIITALPAELSAKERSYLAGWLGREYAKEYGVAVDVNIHLPDKKGDDRNYHLHMMVSACSVTKDGLGKKVAELDPIHCQRHGIPNPAERWRSVWEQMVNARLKANGIDARVDHRTLEEQGIDRAPTKHLGVVATQMERKGKSSKRKEWADKQMASEETTLRLDRAARAKIVETNAAIVQTENTLARLTEEHQKAFEEVIDENLKGRAPIEARDPAKLEREQWARSVLASREKPSTGAKATITAPVIQPPTTPAKAVPEAEPLGLKQRIQISLERFMAWVKEKTGTLSRPGDNLGIADPEERIKAYIGGSSGPIVKVDDLHAMQSTGRNGAYTLHEQSRLSRPLTEADKDKSININYRNGVGQVIEPELESKNKGPKGPGR